MAGFGMRGIPLPPSCKHICGHFFLWFCWPTYSLNFMFTIYPNLTPNLKYLFAVGFLLCLLYLEWRAALNSLFLANNKYLTRYLQFRFAGVFLQLSEDVDLYKIGTFIFSFDPKMTNI